jgi:transmembrane sensor
MMIRNNQSINTIIRKYLMGNATEEEEQQLKQWLNSSAENMENFNKLSQRSDLVRRYKVYNAVDEDYYRKKFRSEHRYLHTGIWRQYYRYAAILLIAIAGASIWFLKNDSIVKPVIPHETEVAMLKAQSLGKQKATLITPNGRKLSLKTLAAVNKIMEEQDESSSSNAEVANQNNQLKTLNNTEYWVTLDDGSKVHLNYSTTLRYPSHFSDDKRVVYLEGEAYFYVSKDSKRPFYVMTPNGTIREYGTSFNVNTFEEEGKTKVVLVEGSISVITKQGKEYMMKPGELSVVTNSSPRVEITKVDVDPYVAWNSGWFVFDNCPLEKIMSMISLWYGKTISFESNEDRHLCYTGEIDRYSSLDTMLKAIEKVTSLDIENTQNKIIIKSNINH